MSEISLKMRDGVSRWSYRVFAYRDALLFGSTAFDPAGNVIAEGNALQDTTYFGRDIQQGSFLFKVDPSGEVPWLVHVMDSGYLPVVRTSGDGTVLLVAHARGPFTWAGQELQPTPDAPEFLVAAGPDGSQLWARQLENSSRAFMMRVHQTGQITIAGGETGCNGTIVRSYDVAGNPLWERVFDPQTCDGHVRARGLTFSNDDVVISGDLQGTVDLGFGTYTFPDQIAFYLGLYR